MGSDSDGFHLEEGSGRFAYTDAEGSTGKRLTIWYRCPAEFGRDTRVLIALHGQDRAAAFFRDCWSSYADRASCLVLVPEFDERSFPGGNGYNYGNVRSDDGTRVNPRGIWNYTILDRIFERVHTATGSLRNGFTLFGHSAGGQFAHRHLAVTGGPYVELAIAANCGWYIAPDLRMPFPAGLGGLNLSEEAVIRYLEQPLILLLGDGDTDRDDPGLSRGPEAMAQGPHRFARGQSYFSQCEAMAEKLGAVFGWRLEVAPGVAHDDQDISNAAAVVLDRHSPRPS
ncbi:MAG: hypothetical protein AAF942_17055 [Pseudomonadota bacterium]